ncbi:hypothetical protein ANCCAN_28989 [Ancylostoma caninum]|uniref:Uncharacterized protein n=1 Tax=Ancylostoma caninum TaxID=29170 RepID=A0A368F2R7_ANCCA|nr:hypothetical protein ANCCAN_28989 [Ancylostoma caninum]
MKMRIASKKYRQDLARINSRKKHAESSETVFPVEVKRQCTVLIHFQAQFSSPWFDRLLFLCMAVFMHSSWNDRHAQAKSDNIRKLSSAHADLGMKVFSQSEADGSLTAYHMLVAF